MASSKTQSISTTIILTNIDNISTLKTPSFAVHSQAVMILKFNT